MLDLPSMQKQPGVTGKTVYTLRLFQAYAVILEPPGCSDCIANEKLYWGELRGPHRKMVAISSLLPLSEQLIHPAAFS